LQQHVSGTAAQQVAERLSDPEAIHGCKYLYDRRSERCRHADVVGFDTAAPAVMSDFIAARV
jgi:hypothetical protein